MTIDEARKRLWEALASFASDTARVSDVHRAIDALIAAVRAERPERCDLLDRVACSKCGHEVPRLWLDKGVCGHLVDCVAWRATHGKDPA